MSNGKEKTRVFVNETKRQRREKVKKNKYHIEGNVPIKLKINPD